MKKPSSAKSLTDVADQRPKEFGAWLNWSEVEKLCRLKLRPASVWPVLLAVLLTSRRYGNQDARLGIEQLAELTGLSSRTVQRALTHLSQMGLVVRPERYRRLQITLAPAQKPAGGAKKLAPPALEAISERGVNKVAPPIRQQADASPTCIYVSDIEMMVDAAVSFTPRQRKVISDVFAAVVELGNDPWQLTLAREHAARLKMPPNTTYMQAFVAIAQSGNRVGARDFVKAVLALRSDSRVQGRELELSVVGERAVEGVSEES